MNREFLKELGLEEESINQIMAEHGKTLNTTKEELTGAQSELDSYKTQLSERDTQLESLRGKAQGNEELQSTIDALKEANEDAKQAHQSELSNTKLNYELDQALLVNKARNPRAVRALLDNDVIKIGEDGKLTGLSEQLESLKETESYLFADGDHTPPPAGHVPGSSQKHNTPTPKDPYEAGRMKAMERHKKEEE